MKFYVPIKCFKLRIYLEFYFVGGFVKYCFEVIFGFVMIIVFLLVSQDIQKKSRKALKIP